MAVYVSELKFDDEYIIVKKTTTVQEVARRLLDGENRAALVIDGKRCIGAITLDIIVARMIVKPHHPVATVAEEIMDTNILTVKRTTKISSISSELKRIKPVAVVVTDDSSDQVIGYVSPMDMVEAEQIENR